MAGMSIARLEEVDRAISDKLELVMKWLIEQGESPDRLKNLQVARVRFKQRYADRLEEFLAWCAQQPAEAEMKDEAKEEAAPDPTPPPPSPQGEPEGKEKERQPAVEPASVAPPTGVAEVADWARELLEGQTATTVENVDVRMLNTMLQKLLAMVREERKGRADRRPAGNIQRRYLIPGEWVEDLEKVANHPAVGLGSYRAVRLSIEFLLYCRDQNWPILQRELTPEKRVALAMGFPKWDHAEHKPVRTDLPKEVIERLDSLASESGVDKSDVVCVAVDQLLALLHRWIRMIEASQQYQ